MNTIVAYDPMDWVRDGETVHIPKFRDADRAYKFLKKHGFYRLPERSELVFLKDLKLAIEYARRVPTRLPEVFETEIKKDPKLTWDYISQVLNCRSEDFEESLSKSPPLLVQYSKEILHGALPENLENCLVGDPYSCFEYSWQILDGRLPETLHNYMFCANMETESGRRYRGTYKCKLNDAEEYNPDYSSPKEYFEFIKWQRKNLHRLITHYQKIYGVDNNQTVAEFLYELEHGR
jgi:hypothetical protein